MAIIKRADGMFLIRQGPPIQWGSSRQAKAFLPMQLQTAIDLAAGLRAAGIEAYASSDAGTIQDPAYVPPQEAAMDLTVRYPGDWTVPVEELGPSRFAIRFADEFQVQRTVLGRSPQEAVDKLQMQSLIDPAVRNYLLSITPQPEAAPVPVAPIPEAPRRFVRPGDRVISEAEYEELNANRAAAQAPKIPVAEIEYANFYNSAPTSDTRKRMKTDSGYLGWLEKTGVLTPRSNADAR